MLSIVNVLHESMNITNRLKNDVNANAKLP
jgi:hypothetical protein